MVFAFIKILLQQNKLKKKKKVSDKVQERKQNSLRGRMELVTKDLKCNINISATI